MATKNVGPIASDPKGVVTKDQLPTLVTGGAAVPVGTPAGTLILRPKTE